MTQLQGTIDDATPYTSTISAGNQPYEAQSYDALSLYNVVTSGQASFLGIFLGAAGQTGTDHAARIVLVNEGEPYSGALAFLTRSSADGIMYERLRISALGLVGIGKTNPAQPLDVQGTISATGLLLGGDILLYGALKDSTGQYVHVDAGGCYYVS